MKLKKADIVMLIIIFMILISGLAIVLKFYNKKQDVVLSGISKEYTENLKEGFVCSIEIRCDTILENMDNLVPQKGSYVPANGIILEKTIVNYTEGENAFDVLKRVCDEAGVQLEYSWTPVYDSYYIEGINHLYEFDCGSCSGWMYKVNDDFPNYGCSSYNVKPDDEIVFCFTCEGLGTDVGAKGVME